MENRTNKPVAVSVYGKPNDSYDASSLIAEAAKRAGLTLPNEFNVGNSGERAKVGSGYVNIDIINGKPLVSPILVNPELTAKPTVTASTTKPPIAAKPKAPVPVNKPQITAEPTVTASTTKPPIAAKPKVRAKE